jgi:lysine 2,3-aminomutase
MKPATEDGEPPNCGSTARDYDTPASYTVPLSQFSAPLAPVISLKPVNRVPQLKINPTANTFRKRFFPEATARDWNDWRWQNRNRIRKTDNLARIIQLSDEEREAISRHRGSLTEHDMKHTTLLMLNFQDFKKVHIVTRSKV